MNLAQRVAKNAAVNWLAEIAGRIGWLAFLVFLAKYLGPKDFGLYNFAFSFAFLFALISDFGIPHILTREASRHKDKTQEYLNAGFVLVSFSSVIALSIIMTIINRFESDPHTIYAVYLAAGAVIIFSFLTLLNAVYRAHEKMEYEALVLFISRSFIVVTGLLLIFLQKPLLTFILAVGISYCAAFALSICIVNSRFVPIRIHIAPAGLLTILRQATPLGISLMLLVACRQINAVFLHFLRGDMEVGIYTAAYRLVEGLSFLSSFLVYAIFPAFSQLYVESGEKLRTLYEKSFKFLLSASLGIGIIVFAVAEEIISVFGAQFAPSASVLRVVIWMFVLTSLNGVSFYLLVGANREKRNAQIGIIALASGIALNLWLIPSWGSLGAAWAALGSEGLWIILGCVFVSRVLGRMRWRDMVLKPIAANVVLAACMFSLRGLELYLVIPFAMIVFVAALRLVNCFSQEEVAILKGIVKPYWGFVVKVKGQFR